MTMKMNQHHLLLLLLPLLGLVQIVGPFVIGFVESVELFVELFDSVVATVETLSFAISC